MKLFTICLVIALSTTAFGQRDIGNKRSGGEEGRSGGGGRPSRSTPPASDNPALQAPPSPSPSSGGGTIIVCCPSPPPIIIFEPPVVFEEEPEFSEATILEGEGFNFSAEEILEGGHKRADVAFSLDNDGTAFIVGSDADIQDLGADVSFEKLESPPSEWSATRCVQAGAKSVYVVWTWDNQFYKFRIVSLGDNRVAIEWAQLDEGRKRAARDDRRNGNERYAEKEVTFGR